MGPAGPPFRAFFSPPPQLRLPHPLWGSKGGSADAHILGILIFKKLHPEVQPLPRIVLKHPPLQKAQGWGSLSRDEGQKNRAKMAQPATAISFQSPGHGGMITDLGVLSVTDEHAESREMEKPHFSRTERARSRAPSV